MSDNNWQEKKCPRNCTHGKVWEGEGTKENKRPCPVCNGHGTIKQFVGVIKDE